MLRRFAAATAVAGLALTSLAACGGDDEGSGDGPVTLQFLSLAWQEASVQANEELVEQWNREHPEIQIEYIQGSWDSVHDQLLTGFEGGDAPDIIHYEAALASQFARDGYLADLSDLLTDALREEIGDAIWETVTTPDGAIFGVPFLLESQVVIANRALLEEANIPIPTVDDPWTWDEFAEHARALTTSERYGVAWALRQPVNRILNLSLNFGGEYFSFDGDRPEVVFGDAEAEVPQRIHDMVYRDQSADPDALSMGGTDPLPGFFAGQYAMLPGSIYLRQQMVEQAPEGFQWVTLPPLLGDSQEQAGNPQTLSIAAQSEHPEEAMQFIDFFLAPENMARLAMGDWLVPTGRSAGEQVLAETGGENGWDIAVASVDNLVLAPFQRVVELAEWRTRIATPAFQEYFANAISLEELGQRLIEGGEQVLR